MFAVEIWKIQIFVAALKQLPNITDIYAIQQIPSDVSSRCDSNKCNLSVFLVVVFFFILAMATVLWSATKDLGFMMVYHYVFSLF